MKRSFRFLGIQFRISFQVNRIKRMSFDIPDWADDCHIDMSDTPNAIIMYWKGSEKYFIELPKCIKADMVQLTPLYASDRTTYNSNRKIVVDLWKW